MDWSVDWSVDLSIGGRDGRLRVGFSRFTFYFRIITVKRTLLGRRDIYNVYFCKSLSRVCGYLRATSF